MRHALKTITSGRPAAEGAEATGFRLPQNGPGRGVNVDAAARGGSSVAGFCHGGFLSSVAALLLWTTTTAGANPIVGFVHVPLNAGYNLVANQMDVDGTGTNNSIYSAVGTNLPPNTQLLAWNGSGLSSSKLTASGVWIPNNSTISNAVNPGAGFFLIAPTPTNVAFVGRVLTATNGYPVLAGYQIVSAAAPLAGGITSSNNYQPDFRDQVLVWNGVNYNSSKYNGTTWVGGEPQLTPGEAVFLNAASNNVWTEYVNTP